MALTTLVAPTAAWSDEAPVEKPTAGAVTVLNRARSLHPQIDASHRALTALLDELKGGVQKLTLATKDLSLVSAGIFSRAIMVCLSPPIQKLEEEDVIGATVETAKLKSCMEMMPTHLLTEIATMSEREQALLRDVLETTEELRIGAEALPQKIQALSTQTLDAVVEYAELKARAVAEYELTMNNPFSSDETKAKIAAKYKEINQHLKATEAKLKEVQDDLLEFPKEALKISEAALGFSSPPKQNDAKPAPE